MPSPTGGSRTTSSSSTRSVSHEKPGAGRVISPTGRPSQRSRPGRRTSRSRTWVSATGGPPSHEARLLGQADLGVGSGEDALQVPDADAPADRVLDAHEVVPDLVDAAGGLGLRAVRDHLAVDVEVAAPLAVPVAVEAEV